MNDNLVELQEQLTCIDGNPMLNIEYPPGLLAMLWMLLDECSYLRSEVTKLKDANASSL